MSASSSKSPAAASAGDYLIAQLIHALPPAERRVFSRAEAASYAGVSTGYFDKLVGDGLLPAHLPLPGVKRWDKAALDRALDRMSGIDRKEANELPTAYDAWRSARGQN